jgi:glycosyltransferase involved in cell wall biosynthesis
MNIRIGIGITTYNRRRNLETLLTSLNKFNSQLDYDLCVADDHSTDDTIDLLIDSNIEFISGPHIGPNLNKNRLFNKFINYQYIILLEDDIEIIKAGWIEQFILTSSLSGLPFLTYSDVNKFDADIKLNETTGINYNTKLYNEVLFYTRKVIDKVGGIDNRFKDYGPGVNDQYRRIIKSGLLDYRYSNKIPSVNNIDDYIINQTNKIQLISNINYNNKILMYANTKINEGIYKAI